MQKTIELHWGLTPFLLSQLDDLNQLARLLRLSLVGPMSLSPSPLSATLTNEAGGLVVAMKNAGSDAFDAVRIGLLGGVHHTSALLLMPSGRCGPGNGPSDVLCIFDKPLAPGASATAHIKGDKAYELVRGVELFVRKAGQAVFSGPFLAGAPATPTAWVRHQRQSVACPR